MVVLKDLAAGTPAAFRPGPCSAGEETPPAASGPQGLPAPGLWGLGSGRLSALGAGEGTPVPIPASALPSADSAPDSAHPGQKQDSEREPRPRGRDRRGVWAQGGCRRSLLPQSCQTPQIPQLLPRGSSFPGSLESTGEQRVARPRPRGCQLPPHGGHRTDRLNSPAGQCWGQCVRGARCPMGEEMVGHAWVGLVARDTCTFTLTHMYMHPPRSEPITSQHCHFRS